jgi:hypothetical protein
MLAPLRSRDAPAANKSNSFRIGVISPSFFSAFIKDFREYSTPQLYLQGEVESKIKKIPGSPGILMKALTKDQMW